MSTSRLATRVTGSPRSSFSVRLGHGVLRNHHLMRTQPQRVRGLVGEASVRD